MDHFEGALSTDHVRVTSGDHPDPFTINTKVATISEQKELSNLNGEGKIVNEAFQFLNHELQLVYWSCC